jgi:hypothetical protein
MSNGVFSLGMPGWIFRLAFFSAMCAVLHFSSMRRLFLVQVMGVFIQMLGPA